MGKIKHFLIETIDFIVDILVCFGAVGGIAVLLQEAFGLNFMVGLFIGAACFIRYLDKRGFINGK